MWTIFYADGTRVDGTTVADWLNAPDTGVQVVVHWREPTLFERPWVGVDDRILWTGEDTYDPFGYGVKHGSLIGDEAYEVVWNEAAYGNR